MTTKKTETTETTKKTPETCYCAHPDCRTLFLLEELCQRCLRCVKHCWHRREEHSG